MWFSFNLLQIRVKSYEINYCEINYEINYEKKFETKFEIKSKLQFELK